MKNHIKEGDCTSGKYQFTKPKKITVMQDLFDLLASSFNPYGQKLKTNLGEKSPLEIVDHLTYISYATQRDLGMTHESCMRIGLGNEIMAEMYEKEQPNSSLDNLEHS